MDAGGHTVAWAAVLDGELQASARITSGELVVFEPSEQAIDFVAATNTRFVIGSAAPHPHDLILGNYSVHTNPQALRDGETEIRRIGKTLRGQGKDSRFTPPRRLATWSARCIVARHARQAR